MTLLGTVPQGAADAAVAFLEAVFHRDAEVMWRTLDPEARRHEAALWVDERHAQEDRQIIGLYDRDQLIDELAAREGTHRLRDRFLRDLVIDFAIGAIPPGTGPDDWGVASARRRIEDEIDVVVIVNRHRLPPVVMEPSLLAPDVFVAVHVRETTDGWQVRGWERQTHEGGPQP